MSKRDRKYVSMSSSIFPFRWSCSKDDHGYDVLSPDFNTTTPPSIANLNEPEGEDIPEVFLKWVEYEEECEIKGEPEEIERVNLGEPGETKEVKIGTKMTDTQKQTLIDLLKEFKDISAWSYEDMSGLDTNIVVHQIPLKPDAKPVTTHSR